MPRRYPPETRYQVIELARSGTRVAQLASTFGMSEATIYQLDQFSEKPAAWVLDHLSRRDDLDAELVDLRDHPLPLFDRERSPAYALRDHPAGEITRFADKIDEADGYIFVSPEYNHGPSAVLKNALDHTFVEWHRKPVAFVGYGNVGGARAIEQLRGIVVELEMAPLRHAVHILPDIMLPAMAADLGDFSVFAPLEDKLTKLVDDLDWWAGALAGARSTSVGA